MIGYFKCNNLVMYGVEIGLCLYAAKQRKVGLMALLARTQCAKKNGLSNYSVQLHSDDYCIHAYFYINRYVKHANF